MNPKIKKVWFYPFALYITVMGLLFVFLSCNVSDSGNVKDHDNEDNNWERSEALVDFLNISFTDQVIDMAAPDDTVTLQSFTAGAESIKVMFREMDEQVLITRYMPEFDPADTLRITANGDTIRSYDWSLVYSFHLSERVPFYEVRDQLQQEPLIEWVDPPVSIDTNE